jgi:ribonuclease P protein component
MRFRAEQHLRRQSDIQRVRQIGRRYECGGFTLWSARRAVAAPVEGEASHVDAPTPTTAKPSASVAGPRVAVIASRAAVGPAVQRNRAKRRLREVFRQHQQHVPADVDLLLVARSSLNRLEYSQIERKFVSACAALFSNTAKDA